jgi:hypothetical protein
MKLLIHFFSILLLACSCVLHAAVDDLWQPLSIQQKSTAGLSAGIQHYRVDTVQLRQALSRAGYEGRASSASVIGLPVENGAIQQFSLVESPIMAPGLAVRYPQLKTYKIYGIDDPYASGRLSISPNGFHGMISSESGVFYIDPTDNNVYRSYARKSREHSQPFSCNAKRHNHAPLAIRSMMQPANRTAGSLQVYRLAVAATAEYTAAVQPSSPNAQTAVENAQDAIVVAINRVNEIYERDLGIRLQIVANNDSLISLDPATDGYTNSNGLTMLDENQARIDSLIEPLNYDIGHVFSTGGGGIASVGSVCQESRKAKGVTGLPNPLGESFYIDFVAHEIGHQFGADHSFNGTTNSCGEGREQPVAFEPGSGSSIMSYAGICGQENITTQTDAMFSAGSINQIDTFTTTGGGASCGSTLAISNPNEPTATAGSDFTIPHKTPFILTASASDPDGDPLTYSWDQIDAGTATTVNTLGLDLGDNSLFRSYLPSSQTFRNFPALGTTLRNQFDDSEVLACNNRTLNFRLTVRDGRSGMAQDEVAITVNNNIGPFTITAFNSAQSLSPGETTLTWDVAGTDQAPVSCSEVDISLLTFNSAETTYFETPLATNESNDGSATFALPAQSSSRARFKVKCSNNIFYDISNEYLTITGSTPFANGGNDVFYNTTGLVTFGEPAGVCVAGSGSEDVITGGNNPPTILASSSSSGSMDQAWLLWLVLSALGIRVARSRRGD